MAYHTKVKKAGAGAFSEYVLVEEAEYAADPQADAVKVVIDYEE